jgi:hypothetical protein
MSEKIKQAADQLAESIIELLASADSGTSSAIANIEFNHSPSNSNLGKGILWKGDGTTKQFILSKDSIFSSETIELAQGKSISINRSVVLSETEIGKTVVKSNLKEVGRLKGLVVDGSININQNLFYNHQSKRFSLGTESPNGSFAISDHGIEFLIDVPEGSRTRIGNYGSHDLELITDNTPWITVGAGGDITLGNKNFGTVSVKVFGKMSVNVKTPDSRADLHIAGALKFSDRIHQYMPAPPQFGNYDKGDIVWNTDPSVGGSVGWVCVRAGSPGSWFPFGEIKQ